MNLFIAKNFIFLLNVIYFLFPAYIANMSGCIFGGKTPIDKKKDFIDGYRIIGDGVTLEGFIYGILFGTLTGIIWGLKDGNILLSFKIGLLLSLGALIGDAVGSFIKRRLGLSKGTPAPILDQLDFFVGAILMVSLVVSVPMNYIFLGSILTLVLHLIFNIMAYFLGAKNVWY
ncbi:MAG: CDP-2,3-bis-(O-geranylgeranyl)-sn-glycerol synthase [Methanobrevibacter sp.]|jgi:CDP-2,3-bis-(O-geranylgeranyl)-sn-glycerol synthase|nr:CDP-2,3-bis-(O-geranylgeranyl)-sn-glycerol synthase [Candidatus Methanovirga procula]